jgi:hypothetical protein
MVSSDGKASPLDPSGAKGRKAESVPIPACPANVLPPTCAGRVRGAGTKRYRKGVSIVRVTLDPAFDIDLPDGWSAAPDEEGGIAVTGPAEAGLLHLIGFEQPGGEIPDPAEELYIFLEAQGIELEEDEIEDVDLASGAELSLCEYLSEDDDEEAGASETTYWLVAVATAPGTLVFCSYTCPDDAVEEERQVVRSILASLRIHSPVA